MYINLSAIVLSLYIPEIFRHRILFNKVILTFYSSFRRNKKVKRIVKKFPDLDGFYILLGNTLNFRRAATIISYCCLLICGSELRNGINYTFICILMLKKC